MSKLLVTVLSTLFICSTAYAQAPGAAGVPGAPVNQVREATTKAATPAPAAPSDCATKAVGKDGKPLAGAAKTSFMKKCEGESKGTDATASCEAKAMSKDGKPLAGAAKTAFVKKCVADAKG